MESSGKCINLLNPHLKKPVSKISTSKNMQSICYFPCYFGLLFFCCCCWFLRRIPVPHRKMMVTVLTYVLEDLKDPNSTCIQSSSESAV